MIRRKYERSQKSVSREGNLEQVVLSGDQLGASLCCLSVGQWAVGGGWEIFTFNFTAYRGKEETQGKYNPHPQSSKLGQ